MTANSSSLGLDAALTQNSGIDSEVWVVAAASTPRCFGLIDD